MDGTFRGRKGAADDLGKYTAAPAVDNGRSDLEAQIEEGKGQIATIGKRDEAVVAMAQHSKSSTKSETC